MSGATGKSSRWVPSWEQWLSRPGEWRNWGRTESARPNYTARPSKIEDVCQVVQRAVERDGAVKALGAGHSFTGIARPRDVALSLEHMRGLVAVDASARRVTLRAGTFLHEIPALLEPHGLAMPNLGDIDRQTLAGAISTGTHGTGTAFGGIATQVVGATLVDGTGQVRVVSEDDPHLRGVAVGLGALGVLVEVTLQCVEAFVLEAVESPAPLDEVIDGYLDRVGAADHYEFYWFPGTSVALTKTNTRLPASASTSPLTDVRRFVDDRVVSNEALRAMCEIGRAAPSLTPKLISLATSLTGDRRFSDVSTGVFTTRRTVRFRESEWAVPLDRTMEAFAAVRSLVESRDWNITFPIEVRAAAADDLWLSTASGRESGYIAVHRYYRDEDTEYFREVEKVMLSFGGRPHWGKMHTRSADFFTSEYPRFGEFLELRDTFDPHRVFANDYLDRVLGV
ncbi:D-arabinono-1,4-lactone oxidase [Tsukamurella sp. 8F]|uniref:D-arabinono-1,4-lactone oxidase n=1 Tax=unclassified Tsukamurella TaxID=2633480 RepID=UPI0023B8CB80|nr:MULTISPECIES: D-arabinono-1,4-lactone oxidase [unclassified Tsukamurella]MDF0529921.1 D-arabinono-1,4-lactone oxidase [Tsukamurella sp. 8J]MDF0587307.1 D-arabinono-1,4-lactone oxidase [Tsukamurella sp. 8F]